eukprot:10559825-Alexandrium_andersonii.AAC.1
MRAHSSTGDLTAINPWDKAQQKAAGRIARQSSSPRIIQRWLRSVADPAPTSCACRPEQAANL